jgi:hypothetical protein
MLERAAGRSPIDTRYAGAPADIESPPRLIEVKSFGRSTRGNDVLMEPSQADEARRNPDFYIYVSWLTILAPGPTRGLDLSFHRPRGPKSLH